MTEEQHKGKEEHSLCPFYYPKLSTVLLLPVVYGSDILKLVVQRSLDFVYLKLWTLFKQARKLL